MEKNNIQLSLQLKQKILNDQNGKCANSPLSKIRNMNGFKCILYINGDGIIPLKSNNEPNGECDHIIPRSLGGTNDEWNLHYLCQFCHAQKTIQDNRESGLIRKLQNENNFMKNEIKRYEELNNDENEYCLVSKVIEMRDKAVIIMDKQKERINNLEEQINKLIN
jgi:HNH endonuclease